MGKSLNGKELGVGITQRKDGLYQARFIDRFGKRQTMYGKTVKEVAAKLRDTEYENAKKMNVKDCGIKLNDWYEIWMNTYKQDCRDTTLVTYATDYNRVRDTLGKRKMVDITTLEVQQLLNEFPSDNMRRTTKRVLHNMFQYAVDSEIVPKNIITPVRTKLNGDVPKERTILNEMDTARILKTLKGKSVYPIVVTALETGMRVGEITGLTWDCVDFEQGLIRVEKTLCVARRNIKNDKIIFTFHTPKTKAGIRIIPMTDKLYNLLKEQEKYCQTITKRKEGFEDLVFVTINGAPFTVWGITRRLNDAVNKFNSNSPDCQLGHITMHCFRHTFATRCIARGMNPKVLQKILGHSSLRMTMDLYCHVLDDTLWEEMSVVGTLSTRPKNNNTLQNKNGVKVV